MTLPMIALAQINPITGDIHGNAAKILAAYDQVSHNCDIVVFPEMALTGYPCEDLILRESFMRQATQKTQEIAEKINSRAGVLLGLPWSRDDGQALNAAAYITDGSIQDLRAKHHLPNISVYDDKRVFTPGPMPEPVMINSTPIGVMICEDLWADDIAKHLADKGVEAIISLNGSVYARGIEQKRKGWAARHAMNHHMPVYYANLVGGQDEMVFDGASFAVNARGQVTHQLPHLRESVLILDDSAAKTKIPDPLALDYNVITLGLRDYVRKNGFEKVLIGLSGGVDSALVAVMACDALGAENVNCVMLPSPFTAQDSLDDAARLAENLGCDYRVMPIQGMMEGFEAMTDITTGLAHENMQSRLRALALMALSNDSGALLLSTGNKSEMAVGYATLYGDMCGAYNPLKDVYKTHVYALCDWRNEGEDLIPSNILTRPPSAELRADQLDSDSLPDYAVLDEILQMLIEDAMDQTAITATGQDAAMVEKIATLLARSEYKRRQSPPGPRITTLAFGRNRRLPITNGYDWA